MSTSKYSSKSEPKVEEKEACPVPKAGKGCEHDPRLNEGGEPIQTFMADAKIRLCLKCKAVYWV